ncbi:MAG: response regulator transcription factor [Solirubrobacterales bacterium]|nr:response regulator transcription factor [Solirubrobacterales bacterium]
MAAVPVVLLVEDELSIAEPFSGALMREGFAPVLAGTAADAIRRFEESAPDVVILDVGLPDGDGRDVCRELRRRSTVPIIMLTARGTETDRIVGLELGADDYVVKPFSSGEVIARIRAILRRVTPIAAADGAGVDRQVFGDLVIAPGSRRVRLRGEDLPLSRKEFDLLACLARDAGRVVRREELMSEVWDENWFGSTKTLDVHIGWLRRKLGDDPAAPRYIHTVRGVGFRFAEPEGDGG